MKGSGSVRRRFNKVVHTRSEVLVSLCLLRSGDSKGQFPVRALRWFWTGWWGPSPVKSFGFCSPEVSPFCNLP